MSTRALQIECLLTPLYDYRNGSLCSAYTVNFYAAGTSTAKNVWTEKEKTNPYTTRTLGSDGTVQVYGDGVYKIDVLDGDGTTVYQWDNVKIQHPNISVVSKSATYTALIEDDYILVNTNGGNVTINLYAAALFTHPICIKNIGSNNVVIDPSGAELIEGASTHTISTQDASAWVFSNGSAWYVGNDVAASATTLQSGATVALITQATFANEGIHILDTNASHDLVLKAGSDLSADRIFSIITGDAARSLTTNQNIDLSTTAYPQFLGLNNGTYNVAIPTNGFGAASKFMMGNSNTIAWFYLNAAPPGWKVIATGADTVLAVSGGAGLYNANGGTAAGESWANLKAHTHTGPSHTHTGPSHGHAFTLAAPNHTHTLATSGTSDSRDETGPVMIINGNLISSASGTTPGLMHSSATTGNPSATALTGSITADGTGATGADGTGASGAQSTADVRPTASIGKLFQLDTA